jgi:hypothetical protein
VFQDGSKVVSGTVDRKLRVSALPYQLVIELIFYEKVPIRRSKNNGDSSAKVALSSQKMEGLDFNF